MPELALYQPDIPQNFGSLLRLSACFALPLHVIEPCGFPLDDKRIRRAGMDYIAQAHWHRHINWEHFQDWRTKAGKRLILMTTKVSDAYTDFAFEPNDIILFGRESSGAPESVHQAVDARLTIPLRGDARSLNLAMSAAMVAGEVMRQERT